jgi:hypothetical protein
MQEKEGAQRKINDAFKDNLEVDLPISAHLRSHTD